MRSIIHFILVAISGERTAVERSIIPNLLSLHNSKWNLTWPVITNWTLIWTVVSISNDYWCLKVNKIDQCLPRCLKQTIHQKEAIEYLFIICQKQKMYTDFIILNIIFHLHYLILVLDKYLPKVNSLEKIYRYLVNISIYRSFWHLLHIWYWK